MGISDEQKAQRDYEILEASMKDQKAKKVIRHIRAEEKEHEKELKGLKKKLPKSVRYV
jgi:rubrerythrin